MHHFIDFYLLTSCSQSGRRYTGLTRNLVARLEAHNAGSVPSTAAARPWRIETAIAFRARNKATAVERYLKSHSGRAFARNTACGPSTPQKPYARRPHAR
ncbi:MAG: GIY-YIG nuclease family protein [Rhodocyclaceae bacterium]|nr:GIY-YIG nuclease family protein [Rhodocyclaceae bacterium]